MKLLQSIKNKIDENKDGEKGPHLEITEVVLVHCNIVNSGYQRDLRVVYIFVPNKLFCQLLDISPETFILLKIFNLEFSCIEVWFTNQNFKQLWIEDKTSINLVIN